MLLLARHGRTASNAAGLLLGRADPPLDEVGRAQAAALVAALPTVTRIVASPLRRAQETAAAFGLPVTTDERWIELDYGSWDGLPLSDLPRDAWETWRGDLSFRPPGGETLAELGRRVRSACELLAGEAVGDDVLVVTHVSPVKAAVAWALDVGDDVVWRLFVAPASVTRIELRDGRAVVSSFNDTAHLHS